MVDTPTTSGAEKLLDFVSGVPKFVIKHPVLTAGTVGLGAGILASRRKAREVEASLQNERMGSPAAKYMYAELQEFMHKKAFLEVKCSYEKTAASEDLTGKLKSELFSGIGRGLGQSVGEAGIGGVKRLVGGGAQAIKEKFFTDPKREKLLKNILTNDPDIAMYEQERPGMIGQAYSTMRRFAPTLSTDPSIVTSFLRGAAMTGGPLDHNVIKGLAEAESAVLRASNEGSWGKSGR